MMDFFLKGQSLRFSIDEIFPLKGNKGLFSAHIIPNVKSKLFPPFHLRYIYLSPELLDKHYYEALRSKEKDLPQIENIEFASSAVQGGYYEIPIEEVPKDIFTPERHLTSDNDIFKKNIKPSPFNEKDVIVEHTLSLQEGIKHLSKTSVSSPKKFNSLYVYCFDVGQGDSCMVIFPNGAVYLIDTNCYQTTLASYLERINEILSSHRLSKRNIKALVITHKHVDHLRGAVEIIRNYSIDNFIINLDYEHPTKPVYDLLSQARKIPVWINCNSIGQYTEGRVNVCIRNPDSDTCNRVNSPDINDSSISLCMRYGRNLVFMTGDAGNTVIADKFTCRRLSDSDNLLKVSHHGSITGTNSNVLNILHPSHHFISVGSSSRYNHPDNQVVGMIQNYNGTKMLNISKDVRKTVCHEITGREIRTRLV